ncbi:MAG: ribonuclease P protein component [Dehalococcoidia bacterium]
MLRERRLRRAADFSAVYRRGRTVSGDALAMRTLKTGAAVSRFGFAVGKRVGNAVVRNRVKRRLRAAVVALPVLPGWDVVVSARPGAAMKDYHELHATLGGLLRRARLLGEAVAAAGGERPEPEPKR